MINKNTEGRKVISVDVEIKGLQQDYFFKNRIEELHDNMDINVDDNLHSGLNQIMDSHTMQIKSKTASTICFGPNNLSISINIQHEALASYVDTLVSPP